MLSPHSHIPVRKGKESCNMYGVVACEGSCCVGHVGVTGHSPCQSHIHPLLLFQARANSSGGCLCPRSLGTKKQSSEQDEWFCPSLLLRFPVLCKSPDGWQYFLSISLTFFLSQLMVVSLFMAPLCAWKRKRGVAVSAVKQLILVLDVQRFAWKHLQPQVLQPARKAQSLGSRWSCKSSTNWCHWSCWDFNCWIPFHWRFCL